MLARPSCSRGGAAASMRCMRSDAVLRRRTRSPGCCAVQVRRSLLPALLGMPVRLRGHAQRTGHTAWSPYAVARSRDQGTQCGRCPAELYQGPCPRRTEPARSHEQRPHSTRTELAHFGGPGSGPLQAALVVHARRRPRSADRRRQVQPHCVNLPARVQPISPSGL